jgi:cell division protein ZapA (FtsZ GTPase activity inhibitor)
MTKNSVAVRIAGHEYKIRSDSDENSLRQIALYVDQAMDRVRRGTGTVDSLDVAVLTCLNLARELLALKKQTSGGADLRALESLIERVEAALPAALKEGAASTQQPTQPSTQEGGAASDGIDAAGAPKSLSDATDQPDASDTSDASGASAESGGATVKTFDLPSVEPLHERETDEALPEARVASGGRDRAS